MKAYRVSPDTDSLCWTITAYLALGRMYDATRLLAEMGDRGKSLPPTLPPTHPPHSNSSFEPSSSPFFPPPPPPF